MQLLNTTHIRRNILTGKDVLVSPHRTHRPWQGKEEEVIELPKISYDKDCYLCPGNTRSGGKMNPEYTQTYVFENDFAALIPEIDNSSFEVGLLKAHAEKGICKVVCFSPNHSQTLSQMSGQQIERVVETWQDEFAQLSEKEFINNVQIFENKGELMGCSNPHPHGQIWAQQSIPMEIKLKTKQFKRYFAEHDRTLLEAYLEVELLADRRIISENEHFVTVVPFWAIWPYETMIIPKRPMKQIIEMDSKERASFASSIQEITKIYDEIFKISFPYSSGIHQAPVNGEENLGWHWHMSFYPPLLRSATVKKFMVGYEMFGMPQRDITPEQASGMLVKIKKKMGG